ncbi:MAG: extracellular solute-binding protein [Treponema sp.]|nr:extracellular solute-binding protein [Treponema sp.]
MKLSLFVCFLTFCLIFSGCQKTSSSSSKNEPITLSFYSADTAESQSFDDTVAKKITERTGVTLKILDNRMDQSSSIDLMIANNNYPDLIFAKSDLSRLIEAGVILPLDNYIEKYGQNMKALYGDQIVKLRYTKEDPSIYSFGTYEIKTNKYETSGNIQIQNAVLKEFGYPKIKTLDDLENLLLAYTRKYPEINGHKTIALSLLTDDWYWYVGLSNPGNYVIGYPDDGQWIVNPYNQSCTYKFLNPQMKLFYKWLNKIYHEGLLDPESFTQNIDGWKSKLSEGYVLATSFPLWSFNDIQTNLAKKDMTERSFAYIPVTVSEKIKDPSLKDYGYSGGWGIAISKQCKYPERAFKFMDYICSEEAQILINWGIENIDYYYNGENKRIAINNTDPKCGVGIWLYPFPVAGPGYIDSTGNPLGKNQRDTVIAGYNYSQKETLKAYGVEMWTDLFPSSEELGVSKHGQVWQYPLKVQSQLLLTRIDNFVKEALIKMILGDQEDFESDYKKMCSDIETMGIHDIENEMTQMIASKMALWN